MRVLFLLFPFLSILFQACLVIDGTFHDKVIRQIQLLPADNPGLRKEHQTVLQGANQFLLSVPDYVDATKLVPRVAYSGVELTFDGRNWRPGEALNFTQVHSAEVKGMDGEVRVYPIEVSIVPPSSEKALDRYRAVSYRQDGSFVDWGWPAWTATGLDQLIEYDSSEGYALGDLTNLRLSIDFRGASLELDGSPGGGVFEHVNMTAPHTLTVFAEDLSSNTVTLRMQPEPLIAGTLSWGTVSYVYFNTGSTPNPSLTVPAGTDLTKLSFSHYQDFYDEIKQKHIAGTEQVDFSSPRTFTVPSTYVSRSFTFTVTVAQ